MLAVIVVAKPATGPARSSGPGPAAKPVPARREGRLWQGGHSGGPAPSPVHVEIGDLSRVEWERALFQGPAHSLERPFQGWGDPFEAFVNSARRAEGGSHQGKSAKL